MASPQLKRRRILLLFLLGVGIPSLALGYLALRGIRNELASQEQRRLSEHRAVSALVNDTLKQRISLVERAVERALAVADSVQVPDMAGTLRRLREEQPLAEAVFHLESRDALQLRGSDLLYRPDGSLSTSGAPAWPRTAQAHMQSARRSEFQHRQYGAALAGYRRAFASVSDHALRGEALVAIARVERKAGQSQAALAACETLAKDYGRVRTAMGLPLGAVASLERGSLLLTAGDSLAALRAFVDLYEGLIEGEWVMERAQYNFFSGQARDSITRILAAPAASDSLTAYRTVADALRSREVRGRQSTDRLLLFQESVGSELRARLAANGARARESGTRLALESGGETYLISLVNAAARGDGVWGVLFDADSVADIVAKTLNQHVDHIATDWVVRGRDGRVLLSRGAPPSSPATLNATFADNFPPWLIEFHARPQSPYVRLFASGQSIYLYMFLLIAGILVFGLVLTIRAVSHELELARLKSDFVSTVSHEFKSPLTSIRHLAEMLQAGSVPSEERRRRYYDVLVEQSARLSSLVTNVLDLARLEEGKTEFTFEALDLGALVRQAVADVQERVGSDGYVIQADLSEPLPPVRGDRNALGRAVTNLLDNAVRYSRDDAREIEVRAFADADCVIVAVADRGVGIPPHEIDKVFDRFFRGGDPLTRTVKGSGLGLALVKEIVAAHGGAVQVQSEVGRGSTFSIRLPVRREWDDVAHTDH